MPFRGIFRHSLLERDVMTPTANFRLGHHRVLAFVVGIALLFVCGGAYAQAPGETTNLAWCAGSKTCLQWTPTATASRYDLVRGAPGGLPFLLSTGVDSCDRTVVQTATASGLSENPFIGGVFWYLVIPTNACGQGSAGNATVAARIVNMSGNCDPTCSDAAKDGNETDID